MLRRSNVTFLLETASWVRNMFLFLWVGTFTWFVACYFSNGQYLLVFFSQGCTSTEAKRSQTSCEVWSFWSSVGPEHVGVFSLWTSLCVLCLSTHEGFSIQLLRNYSITVTQTSSKMGWCVGRGSGIVYIVLHTFWFSVRHCVQSQRGSVLFGPQTQVLDAGGLAVVAGEAACGRSLQQWAVPHLLGMMGQGLVVGLAGQRAQRRRGHVDIHSQVGEWRRGSKVKSRVVNQVVSGSHVLAELLLQTKQAERGGGVRVALRERSAAGQATAGGGGGHRRRGQGRICTDRGRN